MCYVSVAKVMTWLFAPFFEFHSGIDQEVDQFQSLLKLNLPTL
jgi:hypothetical protein